MNENITLHITGMSCGHCEKAVSNTVKNLKGVNDIKINLAGGTANIDFETDKISRQEIIDAINKMETYRANE